MNVTASPATPQAVGSHAASAPPAAQVRNPAAAESVDRSAANATQRPDAAPRPEASPRAQLDARSAEPSAADDTRRGSRVDITV